MYYNQRRGYGFDLWARKDDQALVVEVKSFLETASTITLTSLEYDAANHHQANYLLVVVERINSDRPTIYVIQNPSEAISFTRRRTSEFTAPRSLWQPIAINSLP